MKALDNRFVYDLQERKSESMIALQPLLHLKVDAATKK